VPTEDQLFVALALLGIACLFWRYTIALGAVTLAMTAFAWGMRERARERRKNYVPLQEPPTRIDIRVTESGYSMRGEDFFAESSWDRVVSGLEVGDCLIVQSWRVPRLYLPIDEMRRAGVYDQIRAIVDAKNAEREAARAKALAEPS
jgi:hypothetical protein